MTPDYSKVLDNIGPALFWGVWCFTVGWGVAVYMSAIPTEAAGVKLVASVAGPAAGACFAILGALKVMRETGRRETKRALHRVEAAVTSTLSTFSGLKEKTTRDTLESYVLGRSLLLAQMDIEGTAAAAADTSEGAGLMLKIRLVFAGLEHLLEELGDVWNVKAGEREILDKKMRAIDALLKKLQGYDPQLADLISRS